MAIHPMQSEKNHSKSVKLNGALSLVLVLVILIPDKVEPDAARRIGSWSVAIYFCHLKQDVGVVTTVAQTITAQPGLSMVVIL